MADSRRMAETNRTLQKQNTIFFKKAVKVEVILEEMRQDSGEKKAIGKKAIIDIKSRLEYLQT